MKVHYRIWRSASTPPARSAFILHGLGEHIGCYHQLACFLSGYSYQVCGLDLYGFGESEGKRGHVKRIDDYVDDLGHLNRALQSEGSLREGERLLFGHSMGGLLALACLERFPERYTHAVISSPALFPSYGVPLYLQILGKILDVLWPSFMFNNRIASEQLTLDESVHEQYQEDELRHAMITPRLFNELVKLGTWVWGNRYKLSANLRLLFLVGGEDTVIRREAPQDFAENIPVRSVDLRVFPGMQHDLLVGEGREDTYRELSSWIETRAPVPFA